MRVYNLTDVSTPVLVSRELVRAPVQVGGVMIQPGKFADIPNPAGARDLLSIGAISVDQIPGWYLEEKAKIPSERGASGPPTSPDDPPPPEEPAVTVEEQETHEEQEPPEDPESPEDKPEKRSKKRRRSR